MLPPPDAPVCWILLPDMIKSYAQYNFSTRRHACGREILDLSCLASVHDALRREFMDNTRMEMSVRGVYSHQIAMMLIKGEVLSPDTIERLYHLTPAQVASLTPVRVPRRCLLPSGVISAWRPTMQFTGSVREVIYSCIRDALRADLNDFGEVYRERCTRKRVEYSTDEMIDSFCNLHHILVDDLAALVKWYRGG